MSARFLVRVNDNLAAFSCIIDFRNEIVTVMPKTDDGNVNV